MALFKKIQRQSSILRLSEEVLYEKVAQELTEGMQRQGLMAKAMADANGDPDKTRAFYIKYRVQSMHDESEIASLARKQREEQEAKVRDEEVTAREIRKAQEKATQKVGSAHAFRCFIFIVLYIIIALVFVVSV